MAELTAHIEVTAAAFQRTAADVRAMLDRLQAAFASPAWVRTWEMAERTCRCCDGPRKPGRRCRACVPRR